MFATPLGSKATQEILFAGHMLLLDAGGALFWPAEQLLLVSDLHFEKASFLAQFGSLLPRYDTRDALHKLAALIERYQPRRIVCLGDSFHDQKAFARIDTKDREQLFDLVQNIAEWHWVLGNHDPALPVELPGTQHAQLVINGITFNHEPEENVSSQIVGHFHPKVHVRLGGHAIRGPAFVHDHHILIMPAFGTFTGGLDVRHKAIAERVKNPAYFLIYRDKIWSV